MIKELKKQAQRLLIVETSSQDEFKQARNFYHKCGFDQEAQIKDFYDSDDHKIVFSKKIINDEQ